VGGTAAGLPLPRSALLYWTAISITSRLRWFGKEQAGGRSGTSRASFQNSEPYLHLQANICGANVMSALGQKQTYLGED
jgi:hypothetical protein